MSIIITIIPIIITIIIKVHNTGRINIIARIIII